MFESTIGNLDADFDFINYFFRVFEQVGLDKKGGGFPDPLTYTQCLT